MKILHILIALIIAWIIFMLLEKYKRNNATFEFDASNGTFDEHAQKALENIENLQAPKPRDHFMAARIIDLNGHDGRINNVRVLNNVMDRYMYNLRPYVNNPTLQKDPLDWFQLDQIENFMERHIDIMRANPEYNNFIEAVLQARPKKVIKTIGNVKDESTNKREAFETYVGDILTHTNDPQNVHDSAVNEQLRATWKKLQQTTPPSLDKNGVFAQVQSHINAMYGDEKGDDDDNDDDDDERKMKRLEKREKAKRAMRALNEFRNARYNSTIGSTENDILTVVWARSEMPSNFSRKSIIKDAIVDSLVDMSDDGNNVVCSNGRCARLIESLVFTDNDEKVISGAMTVEQIRNDAFKTSNDILHNTIKEVSKGSNNGTIFDRDIIDVAKSYEDPSVKTNAESEKRFKDLVKGNIDGYLKTHYAGKMSKRDFDNVRDHCIAAIDSI